MFTNSYPKAVLFLILLFSQTVDSLQSQELTYSVTYVTSSEMVNEILETAKVYLEEEMASRNAVKDEKVGYLFLIGASEPNANKEIAFSLTVLTKIEEEIVELGKKEQIFYSILGSDQLNELPVQNKEIREYVSEEYMRQFSMVLDHSVKIVAITELENSISQLIDSFFQRFILME